MCVESTATVIFRGGHRGTVRHAPAHTEQRTYPAKQKQRGERMAPRAGSTFTHGGHRAAASAGPKRNAKGVPHASIQWHRDSHRTGTHAAASPCEHGMQANVPPSPKHSCRALCKYLCVCVLENQKEKETQGDTSTQREAQLDGSNKHSTPQPQQSRRVAAHTHPKRTKQNKRKIPFLKRQGVAVCVALRVSASPGRKENKTRGKKCVLRPTGPRRTPTRHGSLSAPFVAAPPHACSRRGAQGRHHERVGGCASGAVGREHTAPLAGRVQQQTI
ncbi:hypothetical protein TCDM_12865 [Trypanosoma cruzi Dm28c]|uniref:Uncharacterized protein n=1 Tax=Trypanosoma cruzi Dm28c TaxID=1416333 RepID=V5A4H1_TRYCR|nr:hypothetical protein TCDM_12865 [Trypanosoma cruzi Dm28c]